MFLTQGVNSTRLNSRNVVMAALAIVLLYAMLTHPALAQVGGATGTSAATGARINNVLTGFQGIIYAIGGLILSAAFMYVGYGMAFGGKKWSDVANVAYGAIISGAGVLLVGWLFT